MPAETTRAANRERLAARRAAEAAARARAERRRRTVLGGVVAAVAVLVALVAVIVVQTHRTSTSANAAVPANTVDGTVISVGSADAPVTVDLYEDFQCPNCKAFEDSSGKTLAQLVSAGTVQARYHGMAFLDTSANGNYSTRALNAAAVVVATAGPNAFQAFHDLLYAHQPAEGGSGL
ncbi:MAG TPA: thioredoxin domain-containing protein, partial [Blastococcus sp.]